MLDATLLQLAARQFGILGRRQLGDLGISDAQVSRARRAGTIVDVTSRTIRVRSSPDSFLARSTAVSLHIGERGFLSGVTAGRLYGLREMSPNKIHLTVPAGYRTTLPSWAVVRSSSWFDPERDRRLQFDQDHGRMIAEPHRMLYDLAATLSDRRFLRAAEDCWHHQLVTPASAASYLERHRCRGKNGTARFERWLEQSIAQPRPAQSGLELDMLEALRSAGLPDPVRQHPLDLPAGRRIHVDIAWPDIRLCVEPGHTWWHGGDAAIRRDNQRRLGALAIGWETIQLDESLRCDPHEAARLIAVAYHRRAALLGQHRLDRAQDPGSTPPPIRNFVGS